eukprot:751787-Prorocentrum_minimum.AAC.3
MCRPVLPCAAKVPAALQIVWGPLETSEPPSDPEGGGPPDPQQLHEAQAAEDAKSPGESDASPKHAPERGRRLGA